MHQAVYTANIHKTPKSVRLFTVPSVFYRLQCRSELFLHSCFSSQDNFLEPMIFFLPVKFYNNHCYGLAKVFIQVPTSCRKAVMPGQIPCPVDNCYYATACYLHDFSLYGRFIFASPRESTLLLHRFFFDKEHFLRRHNTLRILHFIADFYILLV